MALVLTPEVFLDLMRLCLSWEWERGLDRQKATNNREHPLLPTQVGWTTVDKMVRILCGLGIVSKKQKSVLYKDRRLQHLVLRNTETVSIGDSFLSSVLQDAKKDLVLHCDAAESINREKMLRNMRFYITARGHTVAKLIFGKYAASVTKTSYFAEVQKQEEELPRGRGGVESVMSHYRQKVEEETKAN